MFTEVQGSDICPYMRRERRNNSYNSSACDRLQFEGTSFYPNSVSKHIWKVVAQSSGKQLGMRRLIEREQIIANIKVIMVSTG